MDRAKFSIIIPAYNAGDTLGLALESVIAQDADCTWEAIVVDDGSQDNTFDVCQEYSARDSRIKVFTQSNGGTGAALNEAARHASGEFLVQLGADDMLDVTYMRKTLALIGNQPNFDIFASNALRLFEDGSTEPCLKGRYFESAHVISLEDMIWSNKLYGTAAIRRELFEQIGGFRAGLYNEDYDLWLRLLINGAQAYYQPEYLAFYRVMRGQKTEDTIRVRRGDLAILQSLLKSGKLLKKQRLLVQLVFKQLQLKIVLKKMLGKR